MEEKNTLNKTEFSLESVITEAIKIPGVRVNRNRFLCDRFSDKPELVSTIVEEGPVAAGISREELRKIAKNLILLRTSESSIASFLAGIPGGFALAATIPLDVLQFFGMTLRLAQELSYLYGAQDIWKNGEDLDEKVRNQLILYTGVMFGVSGAAAGVRILSTQLAKTTLKVLPQKALTKGFWFPLVRKIVKAIIGKNLTKATFASGVSKIIPVVGGVISGGLNFASMMPMANRLQETLDKSCFDYSDEDFAADQIEVEAIGTDEEKSSAPDDKSQTQEKKNSIIDGITETAKGFGESVAVFFDDIFKPKEKDSPKDSENSTNHYAEKEKTEPSVVQTQEEIFSALEQLKKLEEEGVITAEEFSQKKQELLTRI